MSIRATTETTITMMSNLHNPRALRCSLQKKTAIKMKNRPAAARNPAPTRNGSKESRKIDAPEAATTIDVIMASTHGLCCIDNCG
mmetsp:Transcript_120/g.262  ORF Transcript_120/g.262 Transcript_120/m.262 type:complete len:85 (-) Transcript_120:819-1073(-)